LLAQGFPVEEHTRQEHRFYALVRVACRRPSLCRL
jgi:hypothetical protein